MRHLETLRNTSHGIGATALFVVWVVFIARASDFDSISLYSLDRTMPAINTAFVNQGTSVSGRVLTAQVKLVQDCVFPSLMNRIKDKADIAAYLTSNGVTSQDATRFVATWNATHREAWNPYVSARSLPVEDGVVSTHNPPVCRCMDRVFMRYWTGTQSFDKANSALRACLATRQHIPRQTVLFQTSPDDTTVTNRKSLSRSGLLMIICIALLGSLYYRMMDPTLPISSNIWKYHVVIAVISFVAFLLPIASPGLNINSFMKIQAGTFLPAMLLFIGVEVVWHNNRDNIKRVIYPHPFFFCLILSSLYMLALVENGVYTQDVLFTFYYLSITIACAYACIVFSSIHNATQFERSKMGQLLLIVTVACTVGFKLIPTFPVNPELNVLWALPAFYVGVVLGGVVFVELYYGKDSPEKKESADKQEKTERDFTLASYLIDFGTFLLVAVVLWYFFAQIGYIFSGDTLYRYSDLLSKRANFELAETGAPHYTNFKGELGTFATV